MAEVLLCIDAISKRFGGLLAVDKASFNVRLGHVTALIGPNGAGKTTLFAIISGFLTPDEGRIVYNGTEITGAPPHILARRGIARTFQIVQPFAGLTVRENIAVGAHLAQPNRVDALAAAGEVAYAVGLGVRLELARALATKPRLVLLDEVLAGLNPSEIRDMVPVIRKIADWGVTILMIEHVMQAVMSLAEQVLVLAEGRIIAEGSPQQVAADRQVIEAYLGHGAAARMSSGAGHG
jgi:branched-chain amino acid transport system ATP-binding protein